MTTHGATIPLNYKFPSDIENAPPQTYTIYKENGIYVNSHQPYIEPQHILTLNFICVYCVYVWGVLQNSA